MHFTVFLLTLVPVAICGKVPDWYGGFRYRDLAPRYAFFNEWKHGSRRGDNAWYIERFNEEVLARLDPATVLADLSAFCEDISRIILLCYEKPSDFCHRHLVADWLRANGTDCTEYVQQVEFGATELI